MTDLAISSQGRLFGISFTSLYEIDPSTAQTRLVDNLGRTDLNALVFTPEGNLLAAGYRSSDLFEVDMDRASLQSLGSMGTASAGDLSIHEGRVIVAGTNGKLVSVELDGHHVGRTVTIGSIGQTTFGLASLGDDALISAKGSQLYRVDDDNAGTKVLADLAKHGLSTIWGMTSYNEVAPGSTSATQWNSVRFGQIVEIVA